MEVNKKSLLGESPLSSGYESRLENWSLWVWIPVPDTIWLIGHIYLLRNCKNVAKDLKITWREGKDGPFLQTRNHNCTTVKKVFELGCVILTKNRDVWTCYGYRKRHGLRILPIINFNVMHRPRTLPTFIIRWWTWLKQNWSNYCWIKYLDPNSASLSTF